MTEMDTRDLMSGWSCTIYYDDGTIKSYWGTTEEQAKEKAIQNG